MSTTADAVTKDSRWPVAETVQRFEEFLTAHGMTVFATIDQAAAARAAGLELRDTVLVVFGNPAGGTPAMVAEPLAALDLPLKLLIWDDAGQTRVSYLDPAALARRYGLDADVAAPLAAIGHLTDVVLGLAA